MTGTTADGSADRPTFGWPEYMLIGGGLVFAGGSFVVLLFEPRPLVDVPGLADFLLQAPKLGDRFARIGWLLGVTGLAIAAIGARLSDQY